MRRPPEPGTEDPLEQLLACGRAHPFEAEIPAALKGWLLQVTWDRERLWSLDLPTCQLAIAELQWHYDLPWWRHAGRWFQVSPREVLQSPGQHPEHHERIAAADLSYPLHVIRRRDRWLIIDGIHRLVKADLQHEAAVDVHVVTPQDLRQAMDAK